MMEATDEDVAALFGQPPPPPRQQVQPPPVPGQAPAPYGQHPAAPPQQQPAAPPQPQQHAATAGGPTNPPSLYDALLDVPHPSRSSSRIRLVYPPSDGTGRDVLSVLPLQTLAGEFGDEDGDGPAATGAVKVARFAFPKYEDGTNADESRAMGGLVQRLGLDGDNSNLLTRHDAYLGPAYSLAGRDGRQAAGQPPPAGRDGGARPRPALPAAGAGGGGEEGRRTAVPAGPRPDHEEPRRARAVRQPPEDARGREPEGRPAAGGGRGGRRGRQGRRREEEVPPRTVPAARGRREGGHGGPHRAGTGRRAGEGVCPVQAADPDGPAGRDGERHVRRSGRGQGARRPEVTAAPLGPPVGVPDHTHVVRPRETERLRLRSRGHGRSGPRAPPAVVRAGASPGLKGLLSSPGPYLVGVVAGTGSNFVDLRSVPDIGPVVLFNLDGPAEPYFHGIPDAHRRCPDLTRPSPSELDGTTGRVVSSADVLAQDLGEVMRSDRKAFWQGAVQEKLGAAAAKTKKAASAAYKKGIKYLKSRAAGQSRDEAAPSPKQGGDEDDGGNAGEEGDGGGNAGGGETTRLVGRGDYAYGGGYTNHASEHEARIALATFFVTMLGDLRGYLSAPSLGAPPVADRERYMRYRAGCGDAPGSPLHILAANFVGSGQFDAFAAARLAEVAARRPVPDDAPLFSLASNHHRVNRVEFRPAEIRQSRPEEGGRPDVPPGVPRRQTGGRGAARAGLRRVVDHTRRGDDGAVDEDAGGARAQLEEGPARPRGPEVPPPERPRGRGRRGDRRAGHAPPPPELLRRAPRPELEARPRRRLGGLRPGVRPPPPLREEEGVHGPEEEGRR
ncbi:hypothetical protein THAOC_14611, partial [Thalassiosira oceanica]